MNKNTLVELPPKLSDIAKLTKIDTKDLIDGFDNTTSNSLSKLRAKNPDKYSAFIRGAVAMKLNITIEDLVYLSSMKRELEKSLSAGKEFLGN